MDSCVFCTIVERNEPRHEIVWQDNDHSAFLDAHPVADGHLLVIPKKHVAQVTELTADDYTALFAAARKMMRLVKETFNCPRVGMAIEGFSVPHVHIHLVPLFTRGDFGDFNHKGDLRKFAEIAAKLRANAGHQS